MFISRRISEVIIIFILIIGLFTSCSSLKEGTTGAPDNRPETGNVGKIATGESVEIPTVEVTPEGTLISYDKAGDTLDGFVLDVPPGAYSLDTSFKISYAPITEHTFGSAVTPISPMISVDNGGQLSAEPIYIRVPVSVPEGYIAMGFLYDEKTGNIESMPLSSADSESVTVSTLHFSSFFISMIEKTLLEKDIVSGFIPGVDDFQFVNRGSYIAQWYFLTKPDGTDAQLYNRYDNNDNQPKTPDLWMDDSYGYRLCSVVQKDYVTATNKLDNEEEKWLALTGITYTHTLVNNIIKWEKQESPGLGDNFTRCLFAYGILVTGQPQQIGIFSNAGGGHSMLVYRADKENLYIADPNYPGNTDRRITYTNETFMPYNSGANGDEIAKGNGKAYEKIVFYPVSAMLAKDKIAQRWAEFKDGTIGNDVFPAYQLKYKDEKGTYQELKDGKTTNQKIFDANATGANVSFYRDGEKLPFDDDFNISLKPGKNLLGIYITKNVGSDSEYVDFKYLTVIYNGLAISPDPLTGETGKEYEFTATMEIKAEDVHYEWMVNNELKDSTSEPTFTFTFPTKGSYTVSVKAFSGNKELGKDDARVEMIDPIKLTLSPNMLKGEINKEYTFEALIENMPEGTVYYDWYVNDVKQQLSTSPSVKLTFTQTGEFKVSVKVIVNDKELGKTEINVTIEKPSNNLPILQQNGFFEAGINIRGINHIYDKNSSPTDIDKEESVYFWTMATPITWNDTKFSGTRSSTDAAGTTMNQTIAGTVSTDGNTLLTLSCRLKVEGTDQSTSVIIEMQNIPFTYIDGMLLGFYPPNPDIQKYIVKLEHTVQNKYMGAVYHSSTYLSPVWTSDASLEIRFRKTLNP
jgi:hypothetical protein